MSARARELALKGEDSKTVQKGGLDTRPHQARCGPKLKASLKVKALREVCKITDSTQKRIDEAKEQFKFSRRRIDSLLKVARTIAGIVGSDAVEKGHFEEAVNYRSFDRKIFV